jgi:anti-sigma B factor antagonist
MNVETREGVTIARLERALDLEGYESLRGPLHALFDRPSAKVILDLDKVSFIDSAGWGLLLSVLHRAHRQGGQLKLLHMSEPLAMVFLELRLERVFDVFDNEQSAIKSYRVLCDEAMGS